MTAILLAAGRSIRMGRDKPLIEIDCETLVQRHIRQSRAAGAASALIICNPDNEPAIRERSSAPTLQQKGAGMSGAVLTGLEATAGPIWLICVNDLVADKDYRTIAQAQGGIVIPTRPLERVFEGGYLELEASLVKRIVEKPPGGCPPGSPANIMIHRWTACQPRLAQLLKAGIDYESAVNTIIAEGARAVAVPIAHWTALKMPADLASIKPAMRCPEVS